MYVLNQKINNLEEKTSVLDNFSQSIFQFVTQKEEARLKQEEEDKLKQEQDNGNTVVYSNNISASESKIEEVEETETEDQQYNVNNTGSGEKISETFESKEILSEMVEELNKSSVQNDKEDQKEDTEQLLQQSFDQKQEQDGLFNLLSSVDVNNKTETKVLDVHVESKVEVSDKKKEEELNKMSLNEIKALAKIKNISVMKSNKPKKKELLIQELLKA